MDDPRTLRRKAAELHERAVACASAEEAKRLHDAGQQLELWADDLEENLDWHEKKPPSLGDKGP